MRTACLRVLWANAEFRFNLLLEFVDCRAASHVRTEHATVDHSHIYSAVLVTKRQRHHPEMRERIHVALLVGAWLRITRVLVHRRIVVIEESRLANDELHKPALLFH